MTVVAGSNLICNSASYYACDSMIAYADTGGLISCLSGYACQNALFRLGASARLVCDSASSYACYMSSMTLAGSLYCRGGYACASTSVTYVAGGSIECVPGGSFLCYSMICNNCPTPSVTPTGTASATVSSSLTPSRSIPPSTTPTISLSATGSVPPTTTGSTTRSPTASRTVPSATPTATPSTTGTTTGTASRSVSASPSTSATQTSSSTATRTVTASLPPPSGSPTASGTGTASASVTNTPSATATPSPSLTTTRTLSLSPTTTRTPSATATPSSTATPSASISPSHSVTATATATSTPSPVSPSPSLSGTAAPTPSVSPSAGALSLTASLEQGGLSPAAAAPLDAQRTALLSVGLPPVTVLLAAGGGGGAGLAPPVCTLLPSAWGQLPSCAALPSLLTQKSLVPDSLGPRSWRLQLASSVLGGSGNATGSYAQRGCLAVLRCVVTAGSTASAAADVPVIHLPVQPPLLHDVVVESPAVDEAGGWQVSFKSQKEGRWVPVVLANESASCGASCAGQASDAALAAAALGVSTSAGSSAAAGATWLLSMVLPGPTVATLIAGADGVFSPSSGFDWWLVARGSKGGVPVTAAKRLQLRPVTLPVGRRLSSSTGALTALVAAVAAGRLARVSLPARGDACVGSDPAVACSLSLLALPRVSTGYAQALLELAAVDASVPSGRAAAAVATLAAAGGVTVGLTYPPWPLQGSGVPGALPSALLASSAGSALASTALTYAWVNTSNPTVTVAAAVGASSAPAGAALLMSPAVPSSSLGLSGMRYVEACAESGLYLDPTTTTACVNVSDPLRRSCAWGTGGSCLPCPTTGALCPGGQALVPLPGYWVPAPLSSAPAELVSCAAPATARCPGGVSALSGATACGEGYLEGSYGCSVCAIGWYPDTLVSGINSGKCLVCPDVSTWDSIAPSLTVTGYVIAVLVPLAAVIVYFHRRNGGTLAAGAARGLLFLHSIFAALQVLVQTQPPPSTALPSSTAQVFSWLQTLQFRAPHPHPACTPGSTPLSSEVAGLAVPLAFACAVPVLVVVTRLAAVTKQTPSLAAEQRSASARCLCRRKAPLSVISGGAGEPPPHQSSQPLRKLRRLLPLFTRLAFVICLLLYGRTLAIAYAVIRCEPVVMSAGAYAALAGTDGTALRAPLGAVASEVFQQLRQCTSGAAAATTACDPVATLRDLPLTVQTLVFDPYIVCGEGTQPNAAALAIAVIAVLGFALPLGYYGYYKVRLALAVKAGSKEEDETPEPPSGPHVRRRPGKRGAPPPPPLAVTNPAMAALAKTPGGGAEVAFFLRGTTKSSRPAFLLVDLGVLHCVIAAKAFFTPGSSQRDVVTFLALSLAPLLAGMVYTGFAKPHVSPLHHWLALAIDALTCVALALSYAAYSEALATKQGLPSTDAEDAVQGLGYMVLLFAILVFTAVFTAFAVTMARGARAEQLRLKLAAMKQAEPALTMTENRLYAVVANSGNPLADAAGAGYALTRAQLASGEKDGASGVDSPSGRLRSDSGSRIRNRREFGQLLATDDKPVVKRVELKPLSTVAASRLSSVRPRSGGNRTRSVAFGFSLALPQRGSRSSLKPVSLPAGDMY